HTIFTFVPWFLLPFTNPITSLAPFSTLALAYVGKSRSTSLHATDGWPRVSPRGEQRSSRALVPALDRPRRPGCYSPRRRRTASIHRRRGLARLWLPRATDSRPRYSA